MQKISRADFRVNFQPQLQIASKVSHVKVTLSLLWQCWQFGALNFEMKPYSEACFATHSHLREKLIVEINFHNHAENLLQLFPLFFHLYVEPTTTKH